MKKTISLALTLVLLACTFFCVPVGALTNDGNTVVSVEYLENGDYIETIIVTESSGVSTYSGTKTGTKTANYKNSAGAILWSVTIRGTFSYNGSTAICTSCSHSTTSPGSNWYIKSSSSSRSGATATAYATAHYSDNSGSFDKSMSISVTCSKFGVIS